MFVGQIYSAKVLLYNDKYHLKHFFTLACKLWLVFFALNTHAQTITAVVADSTTKEPIPFVNVGIPKRFTGTVSSSDGTFKLNISNALKTDTVLLYSLGYKVKQVILANFTDTVYLSPNSYTTPIVEITPTKLLSINKKKIKPNKLAGFVNNELGTEIGTIINVPTDNAELQSVNFATTILLEDTATLRLNIYKLEKDLPNTNILSEPIYFKVIKGIDIVKVITTERSITLSKGQYVVSVEMIQNIGTRNFYFGLFKGKGKAFARQASLLGWEELPINIALWVELGYK